MGLMKDDLSILYYGDDSTDRIAVFHHRLDFVGEDLELLSLEPDISGIGRDKVRG